MKKKPKKASIGDIVEISTPAGLGYVQYTHDGGDDGELVRVLPGLYGNRPSDFAALARQKELYFVFYIMNYSIRAGWAEIVSSQPVPEWAKAFPLMRQPVGLDSFWTRWRIMSADNPLTVEELIRTPVFTELTPEQKKLSIRVIRPHAAMVKELARGWTPERAEELHLKDVAEAAEKRTNQAADDDSSYRGMRHFLYFPQKRNAQGVSEQLRNRGFSVKVDRHPDGEQWAVIATKDPPPKTAEEMDELRDEMEGLAAQFGGDYDGWEASMDSLGPEGSDWREKVN